MGASDDLGKQQISIYPYQDLTSINGDQILLKLFSQGMYEAEVTVTEEDATHIDITIKKGTTFVFESVVADLVEGVDRPIIVKVVLDEDVNWDGTTYLTKEVIWSTDPTYAAAEFLFLYATWDYSIAVPANRYAVFHLGTDANYAAIKGNAANVIICKILNHQHFVGEYPLGDLSLGHYSISYETKENRNYINQLKDSLNIFPVEFDGDGEHITVTTGTVITGNTVITNTSTSVAPPAALVPTIGVPSDYFQIDVLRYKYGNEDPDLMVPELAWESFLFAKPDPEVAWDWADNTSITQDMIKGYLHGKRLDVVDTGYNILYLVRKNSIITTVMWPEWCYIPSPLIPRIGEVETTTRLSVPIY